MISVEFSCRQTLNVFWIIREHRKKEVIAATELLFDVCVIYTVEPQQKSRVIEQHFCRMMKWSSARVPDIMPETRIIALQFGSAIAY